MISGGMTDRDLNKTRKAHGRWLECYGVSTRIGREDGLSIKFELRDLGVVSPHDDALVVKATIANNEAVRVFIDMGSSINALFKDAFDQI